jgi:ribosome recycling factor
VDASVERVNTAIAKGENADPAEITGALTDLNTQAVDLVASRKTIWEQLSKLGETKNQGIKKVLDDYKGKVTTIANGMKKAEDDANKLETQIRAVITSYQRVATQMNKTDLVDGIRELLDRF